MHMGQSRTRQKSAETSFLLPSSRTAKPRCCAQPPTRRAFRSSRSPAPYISAKAMLWRFFSLHGLAPSRSSSTCFVSSVILIVLQAPLRGANLIVAIISFRERHFKPFLQFSLTFRSKALSRREAALRPKSSIRIMPKVSRKGAAPSGAAFFAPELTLRGKDIKQRSGQRAMPERALHELDAAAALIEPPGVELAQAVRGNRARRIATSGEPRAPNCPV